MLSIYNVCQGNLDEPGCVQKDDAIAIIDRLLAADVIIYATPLYVWDFSSQMKALLDRQYCLTKWHDGQIVKRLYTDKHVAHCDLRDDGRSAIDSIPNEYTFVTNKEIYT